MPSLNLTAYEWATLAIQTAGVGIVFIYTLLTWRQVGALRKSNETNGLALAETRRSNQIASEALIMSRRVWLTAQMTGEPVPFGQNRGEAFVVLRNVGNMPAVLIEFGSVAVFRPDIDLGPMPQIDLRPATPLTVQEESFNEVGLKHLGKLLDHLISRSDRQVLHVVARAKYDDGFGVKREVRFGWYLGGQSWNVWFHAPGVHHLE